jgi:hypothetical protein
MLIRLAKTTHVHYTIQHINTNGGLTMKRLLSLCLCLALLSPLSAFAGGLEDFLTSVNVQARADLPGFSARISTQFGVPIQRVETIYQSVREPADAFMIFQLGHMAGVAPERVLSVYTPRKTKGWGNIAKQLGIKPGSAEFHALKNGNLAFTGVPSDADYHSKGKGKGRGKGHNK